MLTILIAIVSFLAGVIITRLNSNKKIEKVEAAAADDSFSTYMEGFRKGYADGNTEGRRAANLDRITGRPIKY